MGSSHIEIEEFITAEKIEAAHGMSQKAMALRNQQFAAVGWRAARAVTRSCFSSWRREPTSSTG